jgi:hypothetical protein
MGASTGEFNTFLTIDGSYAYVSTNYHYSNNPLGVARFSLSEPLTNAKWASGFDSKIYGIVSYNNHLYVSQRSGTIAQIPMDNPSDVSYSWASGLQNPYGLAVAGNYLYASQYYQETIAQIPLDNPSDVNYSWASGLENPLGLAVAGNYLYASQYIQGTIAQIPLNNPLDVNYSWASGLTNPYGLAVAGNDLYVGNSSYSNSNDSNISKINLSNPQDISFVTWIGYNQRENINLAADNEYLYTSLFQTGTIRRIPLNPSPPPVYPSNKKIAFSIAGGIYKTQGQSQSLYQCFVSQSVDGSWNQGIPLYFPNMVSDYNSSLSPHIYGTVASSYQNGVCVGSYELNNGFGLQHQAFLYNLVDGQWVYSPTLPEFPNITAPFSSVVYGVSASSKGNAVAVGSYSSNLTEGNQVGFLMTQTNGTWNDAEPVKIQGEYVPCELHCVSSSSDRDAIAGGFYQDGNPIHNNALVVGLKNNQLQQGVIIQMPFQPSIYEGGNSFITCISASSNGNGVAGGNYVVNVTPGPGYAYTNVYQAFLVSQINGEWTQAVAPFVPEGPLNTSFKSSVINSISASSGGNAVACGQAYFITDASHEVLQSYCFIVEQKNGVWDNTVTPIPLPGSGLTTVNPFPSFNYPNNPNFYFNFNTNLTSVSTTNNKNAIVSGYFFYSNIAFPRIMMVRKIRGVWKPAEIVVGDDNNLGIRDKYSDFVQGINPYIPVSSSTNGKAIIGETNYAQFYQVGVVDIKDNKPSQSYVVLPYNAISPQNWCIYIEYAYIQSLSSILTLPKM